MRETAKEASAIDGHDAASMIVESTREYSNEKPVQAKGYSGNRQKHRKGDNQERSRSGNHRNDKSVHPAPGSNKRGKPDCLNPRCKEKHFMNDCTTTSAEEKKRFLSAYHEAKKRKAGAIGQVAADNLEEHSSLFSASFCNGAVEATVPVIILDIRIYPGGCPQETWYGK